MSISAAVKSIQDIMRKDVGVDGDAQRISQLGWMLFLKILDDQESELELLDSRFKSPIPEPLRWRNWAADSEGITGDGLLKFINDELFEQLRDLARTDTSARALLVRDVFSDAYNYMKNGTLIRQVLNKINEIDFNSSQDRHIFGDIYEHILRDLQSAGNAGEYYTPRAVTQFMTDIIKPRLGEKILDPACGTGGFLTGAIEAIRHNDVRSVSDEELLEQCIVGIEKKPLPHLLCTTNMLLHRIAVPSFIRRDNALSRPLRDYTDKDRVDVIMTNPPFGGVEEDGIELNFPTSYRTRETADLFLLLIGHLLKPGGRAAIVLPDGSLSSEGGVKTRIKEHFLNQCSLETVVRLPNGVFNPYATIATNLLFFTKGQRTTDVWYYEHPYPPGYRSYSKTKPIRIDEFEPEKMWWQNREESEFAWKVTYEQIERNNYKLNFDNPNRPQEDIPDLDALLAELESGESRLEDIRSNIKDELLAALANAANE